MTQSGRGSLPKPPSRLRACLRAGGPTMNFAEWWSPGAQQHAALDTSIAEDLWQKVETESGLLAQIFTIKLRKSQTADLERES